MDDELVESALNAINKVFGDMSVPRSVTRDRLRDLAGEISTMLDALQDDE